MFSAFNSSKCTHTWSSGQPTLRCPGSSWGFGALLKGLTSVVDNSCRSRDSNPQPRVTSPTLYPLGQGPSWGAHNEKAEAPHVSGGALKCAILISKIHRHWMSETLFTCQLPLCSSKLKPSLLSKSKNVHFMMAFKFKCSIQHLIS